jgi:hypothetical protein
MASRSPSIEPIHPKANGAAVHQTAGRPHLSLNQSLGEVREQPENNNPHFELIDAPELARRWRLPESWIREQTRSRCADVIPHLRLGRYVRFEWGSPELAGWLTRRRYRKDGANFR